MEDRVNENKKALKLIKIRSAAELKRVGSSCERTRWIVAYLRLLFTQKRVSLCVYYTWRKELIDLVKVVGVMMKMVDENKVEVVLWIFYMRDRYVCLDYDPWECSKVLNNRVLC